MAVLQKQHLSGHAAKGKKLGPPKLKKSWEVIADAGDATYNMLSAKKYRVRVCVALCVVCVCCVHVLRFGMLAVCMCVCTRARARVCVCVCLFCYVLGV